MQEKDKFLRKINFILLLLLIFVSQNLVANNNNTELLDYNNKLNNSSAFFIQTDGSTIEEGIVYIGFNRIKLEYKKPKEITIVISEKKSMYVNHELKETQYFDTNKSIVKVFLTILTGQSFYEKSELDVSDDQISINTNLEINEMHYKTKIIYENDPIVLKKIIILENEESIEIGLFNHNNLDALKKDFFSLINPYLN